MTAETPWNACSSSSDSLNSGRAKGPYPRSVPQIATPASRTTTVAASRCSNRNATHNRNGTHRNSSGRSEEHTSELQSLTNLVCRLLLEKKKKKETNTRQNTEKVYQEELQERRTKNLCR